LAGRLAEAAGSGERSRTDQNEVRQVDGKRPTRISELPFVPKQDCGAGQSHRPGAGERRSRRGANSHRVRAVGLPSIAAISAFLKALILVP
jgi:hypothetical protein